MAETLLVSSILKNDTYPKFVDNISAKYCCGAIKILLDSSYTEQMISELPNITINIYTEQDGEKVLYTSRAITMQVPNVDGAPIESVLIDIPTSFTFAIIPEFDEYALLSHNKEVKISGGDMWLTPTAEFPITIIWDDTNVYADQSGGGGGGGTAADIEYDNTTSGITATNVQDAIDEVVTDLDNKLDTAPDGTNDLIDNSGVIDPKYLPDYLLGQVIYGGNVATNAVATLTTTAQHKLGTTLSTITLTNDTTDISGYEANEGIYYIATADFIFADINITSGDWLISIGTKWTKVDTTNEVTGVKGDSESVYRTGNVNITMSDIGLTIDDELSIESENPVQNKVITDTIGDVDAVLEAVLSRGFVPTEEQLEAMNSGITANDVAQIHTNQDNIEGQQNTTASGGNGYALVNGIRLYVASSAPTGTIPDGSVGVGW